MLQVRWRQGGGTRHGPRRVARGARTADVASAWSGDGAFPDLPMAVTPQGAVVVRGGVRVVDLGRNDRLDAELAAA
jgi:hypothetical protein